VALLLHVPQLDEILAPHAEALGRDLVAYRNHAHRVVNFCVALAGHDAERLRKFAIAAAFHDLGIWTARTFDYIEPSVELARAWLAEHDLSEWSPNIETMIRQHHKITAYRGDGSDLVETFRQADTIDVSLGLRRFGIPADQVRAVRRAFPNAGFHWRLLTLTLRRLVTHPLSPLPMYRL
jgi:hypothetical protein